MMRWAALSIVAFVALAGAAPAQEPQTAASLADMYRRVGPWAVWRARDDGRCFLDSQTRGPTMFIGYTKKRLLSVGLTHDAWKSLEVGKDYPMVLQIDDQPRETVMNTWRRPGGTAVVLGRDFTDEAEGRRFLEEFQRGSRLAVLYQGRVLATFVLQYSSMAGAELLRCQAAAAPVASASDDPFKPRPSASGPSASGPSGSGPSGSGPATDKPAPAGDAAAPAAALPTLTAQQQLETVRLAANLLTRMPGFRILNEEEQKSLEPRLVALRAAVVWRTEGAYGLLHLFPGVTESAIPRIAGAIVGGLGQQCDHAFKVEMAPDVRAAGVRRIQSSCVEGRTGSVMRVILMPFKGGVYYLSTAGELKDNTAVARAEELLRNALFEVVPK